MLIYEMTEVDMKFKLVQYGVHLYPDDLKTDLVELAWHFDKESIPDVPNYSLHTEYSYETRNLSSELIAEFCFNYISYF